VTIPHKRGLLPYLDGGLSPAATAIGAINTITALPPRRANGDWQNQNQCYSVKPRTPPKKLLHGDNTDWVGIVRAVAPHLGLAHQRSTKARKSALVIGGGATGTNLYTLSLFISKYLIVKNLTQMLNTGCVF
jgi:shikimate 5-dehydrogenase